MGMQLPAPLQWVIGFLGLDAWPEADEDALRDMAKAYSKAAKGVSQSAQETLDAAGALGSVIEGDVHDAMKAYFDAIAGEGGLAGIVKNLEACGDACDQAADATLEGKIAYAANVAMLAATVASALGAGPFTFGGSTAAIPAAAAATRMSLWAVLKRLVAKNLAAVAKDVAEKAAKKVAESGATKVAKDLAVKAGGQLNKTFIQLAEKQGGTGIRAKIMDSVVMRQPMVKGALIGGSVEAGKEGALTVATGENHFDPSKIVAQSALGAVASPIATRRVQEKILKKAKPDEVPRTPKFYEAMPGNVVIKGAIQHGVDFVAPQAGETMRATSVDELASAVPGPIGETYAEVREDVVSKIDGVVHDVTSSVGGLNLDTSGGPAK
ncbi:hypothetical protein [Williamsia sp. CHRR-6]|uniref:WXG100-like domain-containing protein n=1 Tax=Williamsia sp. CHRR-6 TaxID=2835871 RepID=UPI001BD93AD4|nr:hypothetical protein [Williamsia sp. CHRR-6]MBT0567147.1 hypothetical protein [Williamsia sp. CHRR-6]